MSKSINTRTRYKIVGSDYSAQEPRLTTFLSGEPKMYDAYNNNKDLYAIIAQSAYHNEYGENLEFWPEGTELEIDGKKVITGHKTHLNPAGKKRRATGKLLNLATSYGMAAATAGAKMGLTGDEARVKGQELLDNFFAGFPKVHEAIEGSKEFLRKNGYVEDFVGRRRRLPDINMQPYEARLKDLKDEGATFNPFLGCSNKRTQNDPEEIWTVIMLAEAVLANARKLAIDVQSAKEDPDYKPVYKAEYSMANATFSKLKKIAANPEWYLDNKSFYDLDKKADKYSASCRERLMKDITAVKELMSTRSYKLQKGRQSTDVILPAHTEFDAILDRFRADCADKLPAFIPNDRVDLFAWTGRISQAARQCYNARVQGSAASLTKIAMVDISRDQELNDCQAKLIIPVHDELLMECPAYYADRVAKRLPEVMIAAAAEVGDDVPQACDPYVVGRWYADEYAAAILEEYQKLEKSGMDKAVARQQIFKAHAEIPQEAIEAVLSGETDQLEF